MSGGQPFRQNSFPLIAANAAVWIMRGGYIEPLFGGLKTFLDSSAIR
jgi:hypothetical protein